MMNIKKLTSVTVFQTGEGKRISGTYSEIGESGALIDSNVRFNFIAMDKEFLTLIDAVEGYVQNKIEGDLNGDTK